MSLPDAVLEVANAMDVEASDCGDSNAALLLRSFARELRTAVKACESLSSRVPPVESPHIFLSPEAQHRAEIDKAREEMRRGKGKISDNDSRMVTVLDGPLAEGGLPTVVSVDSDIKLGDMPVIAGNVYRYGLDDALHFMELETLRYRECTRGQDKSVKIP